MSDFQNIIDNISNIEDLDNVTILKTLKAFEKYIIKNSLLQSIFFQTTALGRLPAGLSP